MAGRAASQVSLLLRRALARGRRHWLNRAPAMGHQAELSRQLAWIGACGLLLGILAHLCSGAGGGHDKEEDAPWEVRLIVPFFFCACGHFSLYCLSFGRR